MIVSRHTDTDGDLLSTERVVQEHRHRRACAALASGEIAELTPLVARWLDGIDRVDDDVITER